MNNHVKRLDADMSDAVAAFLDAGGKVRKCKTPQYRGGLRLKRQQCRAMMPRCTTNMRLI